MDPVLQRSTATRCTYPFCQGLEEEEGNCTGRPAAVLSQLAVAWRATGGSTRFPAASLIHLDTLRLTDMRQ